MKIRTIKMSDISEVNIVKCQEEISCVSAPDYAWTI